MFPTVTIVFNDLQSSDPLINAEVELKAIEVAKARRQEALDLLRYEQDLEDLELRQQEAQLRRDALNAKRDSLTDKSQAFKLG